MPSLETDTTIPGRPHPPSDDEPALGVTLDRLGAVLDKAQARDPARLSTVLRTDPVRADLRAVLASMEPAAALPLLHRLALAGLTDGREVLDALLADDLSGSGQALRAKLHALHRRALLARIFHPDRVQALRRACRPLNFTPTQEAA